MSLFIIILSNNINYQFLELSIPNRLFIGNSRIKSSKDDGKIVTLKCSNYYENLSTKAVLALDWALNNTNANHIMITEDVVKINEDKLLQLDLNNVKYGGHTVEVAVPMQSTYHYNKCYDKTLETPVNIDAITYCNSKMIILDKNTAKNIVKNMKHDTIFLDYNIGKYLKSKKN